MLGLCRGDYDVFCDNDFKIKKEDQETCIGNIGKVIQRQARNVNNGNIVNSAHSLMGSNLDLIGSHYENNGNSEISDMQKIVLSAVINGLVIVLIIAVVAIGKICYTFYFSDNAISMLLQNISNKMKYGKLSSSDESDLDQQEDDIDR